MAELARADWPPLPDLHAAFIERALERLPRDERIVAIALGGSFVTGGLDELSDLDFVIAVEPAAWPELLDDRRRMAADLGDLLEAFPGDHVGEPRLLICLYGPPLLHVDLKFVSLEDADERVEDPAILWERGGRLSEVLERTEASYPRPDHAWIEDRFWIWVHYTALKIERGELFEALASLDYFRSKVLGPLGLERAGAPQPGGVRRIERLDPGFASRLAASVAEAKADACLEALGAVVELYGELRRDLGFEPQAPTAVEREVRHWVEALRKRLGLMRERDRTRDARKD